MVDATMDDAVEDCLSSLSSHLTTSPSAATISTSTVNTATASSTTMSTSEVGTIHCEYCMKAFRLGVNGRRGQISNRGKHIRRKHPETLLNYQQVLHECRWGCGRKDADRSNIKAHEKYHCAIRQGKRPRCYVKRRETTTL